MQPHWPIETPFYEVDSKNDLFTWEGFFDSFFKTFVLFLLVAKALLLSTGANMVFQCVVAIVTAAWRSTLLFTFCGFSNRKPATVWFHPPNPPVPMTGSCWWRTFGEHWISRKMLQVRHLLSVVLTKSVFTVDYGTHHIFWQATTAGFLMLPAACIKGNNLTNDLP